MLFLCSDYKTRIVQNYEFFVRKNVILYEIIGVFFRKLLEFLIAFDCYRYGGDLADQSLQDLART